MLPRFISVRALRGTERIIVDYRPSLGTGYGFLFYQYGSEPFWDAIKRAREVFANRTEWERLMKRTMALDFSWAQAAGLVTRGRVAA